MVGRMGGGLYFLIEIELKMSKIPHFTYLNAKCVILTISRNTIPPIHTPLDIIPHWISYPTGYEMQIGYLFGYERMHFISTLIRK